MDATEIEYKMNGTETELDDVGLEGKITEDKEVIRISYDEALKTYGAGRYQVVMCSE